MLRHLIAISKQLVKLAKYQIVMKTLIATALKLGSFARGKLDTTTTTKGNNKMKALKKDWESYTGDKLLTLPRTRQEAKKVGSELYFTSMCKHGHDCPRSQSGKACVMCVIAGKIRCKARKLKLKDTKEVVKPYVMAFGMKLRVWQ